MCLYTYSFIFTFTWRRCIVRNGWRIELLAKILEENKSLLFSATFYYASSLWHLKVQTARRLTSHVNRPLERKLYGKILRYIFFCNFNCVWRIFGHDLPRIRWDGKQFNGSLLTVVLEKFYTISVVSGVNGSIWLPLRLIKAWVTLPLTHIFLKIENNLAILRGIFLILGRNVYHYHLSRTELWQRNMILSTAKNS